MAFLNPRNGFKEETESKQQFPTYAASIVMLTIGSIYKVRHISATGNADVCIRIILILGLP